MFGQMMNMACNAMFMAGAGEFDITPEETMPPTTDINSVEDTVSWMESAIKWCSNYVQETLVPTLLPIVFKLIIALLIFFIGKKIVKKAINILSKSFEKSNMEEGTAHFLCSILNGVGMIVLIFIIASYLNFSTGPIVAILGSAGLAVGLALQGSLSNFAGGVLLLLMKPFRVGDYICALGNEGTVVKIDIVYTTLMTGDNRKIVIPNGSLSNANIVNVTNEPMRRVDILVGVDYSADIRQVKEVLEQIVAKQELILKDQDISIFVDNFDASAVSMGLRVWTETENYWKVKWDLQEQIKNVFDEKGISIPYNRLDVNVINEN